MTARSCGVPRRTLQWPGVETSFDAADTSVRGTSLADDCKEL